MKILKSIPLIIAMLLAFNTVAMADSPEEIKADAKTTLQQFYHDVSGGKKFLEDAKGYVIFPDVNEVGFFVGGKYGEGVLVVDNTFKSFHSITAASVGFQVGAQNYSLIIAFTSDSALKAFMNDADDDWDTKMDFSFSMNEWNSEEELDDIDFGSNMIGFVFDSTGLMGNFTMEGTKFETIIPD